jgi:hypothetical protein
MCLGLYKLQFWFHEHAWTGCILALTGMLFEDPTFDDMSCIHVLTVALANQQESFACSGLTVQASVICTSSICFLPTASRDVLDNTLWACDVTWYLTWGQLNDNLSYKQQALPACNGHREVLGYTDRPASLYMPDQQPLGFHVQ